jgi:hypothetical protein
VQSYQVRRLTIATPNVRLPTLGCFQLQHAAHASARGREAIESLSRLTRMSLCMNQITIGKMGVTVNVPLHACWSTSADCSTVSCAQAYVSSPAALPPGGADEVSSGAGAATPKDASGPGRSILPAGVWATEAFFEVCLCGLPCSFLGTTSQLVLHAGA